LEVALQARLRENLALFDASELARVVMGDAIFSNMMVFGAAWQKALVPISHEAIVSAIELNGAAVEKNLRAFEIGRWAVLYPEQAAGMLAPKVVQMPKTLDEKIAFRAEHLVKYQGPGLAKKYRKMVDGIEDTRLKRAVALGYHKLLSYKDEYEVARLHLETRAKAEEVFEGNFEMKVHLSPPLVAKEGPNGRPLKTEYGKGMMRLFPVMAKMKGLRGTPLDPFGRHPERKMERALIAQYETDMARVITDHGAKASDAAVALAELPLQIKGFGPVKVANEANAAKRREEILAALQHGDDVPAAAE
jgi:indolepyruvate ferredoxin oxidoreductase